MRSLTALAACLMLAGCATEMKDACGAMPAFCDTKTSLAEAKPADKAAEPAKPAKPEKKGKAKKAAPAPELTETPKVAEDGPPVPLVK